MNPYSPPAAAPAAAYASPPAYAAGPASVGESAIECLRQTRPWVQLLSVLAFLGSAFMLLFGLGMTAVGFLASGGGSKAAQLAIGLVYIPISLFYIYPGIKLWAYGSAIGRLLASHSAVDLEAALGEQKSFWKFCGIATLVALALYAIAIVVGAVVGVFAAAGKGL